MAEMIPQTLPSSATHSENMVYMLLKRLGPDCLVYYEPFTNNRNPDFVVIIPDLGVLVIEAKGWRRDQIIRADSDRVTVRAGNARQMRPHPHRQARDYMRRLWNVCGRHKWSEFLLQRSGPHEGNFTFPFSYLVMHTNLTRVELEEGDASLSDVFPAERNATRDVLEEWRKLKPADLKGQLARFFDPRWPTQMTGSQLDVLKAVISPIANIDDDLGASSDLKVLDHRQEAIARQLGTGHRVVYGVAGSGKTVILIARAKFIGGAPGRRVLILCYNKYLAQLIRLRTQGCGDIQTHTFHAWGARNGVRFIEKEKDEAHAERLLHAMQNGAAVDAGQFDAVLVDESQVLQRDWLKAAKLALKDPSSEDAHLFIAGDGTQSLFRKRSFTWAEVGVSASGRTTILRRNYRNTGEILGAAVLFAAPGEIERAQGPGDATPSPECLRRGPAPELIELQSRQKESDCAAALIQSWLVAGVTIRGRRQTLRPSDIAILYPHLPNRATPFLAELKDRLAPFTKAVILDGQSGSLSDEGVRIISIQRATGLQFKAVIMLWTDLLPANFADRDDRTLLYLAMTRAEDVLVILHSRRSELVDEIARALGGQNATSDQA